MTQRATREIADCAQTLKRAASLSGETAPGWSGLITMVVVGERSVMRESLVCFIDSRTTEFSILSLDDADALDELDADLLREIRLVLLCLGPGDPCAADLEGEIEALKSHAPAASVMLIAVSEPPPPPDAARMLGVSGYLTSTMRPDIVIHALRLVSAGGVYMPKTGSEGAAPAESSAPVEAPGPCGIAQDRPPQRAGNGAAGGALALDDFTARERDVLRCLSQGTPNKLIAYELDLKESTVKVHVRNILKKLGVHSRTQAALHARENWFEHGNGGG